jgi:integrase
MSVRMKGSKYYIAFRWKQHRMDTASSATSMAEAKRIEKAVKTAFKINRFDHLDPMSLEVVMRIFQNKGWELPDDLAALEPKKEITLLSAIEDYFRADEMNEAERNLFAIDRLMEHFKEHTPLKEIKTAQVKQYRTERQKSVQNGTVNREFSVLSGIFRVQVDLENIDYNPCLGIKRLPENQRDTYLSWQDFNLLLEHSWWLRDVITMCYYTGMRFNEVAGLRWEMYKPERRMLVIPPKVTKEGKSDKKLKLRPKRIPLRPESVAVLESLRKQGGEKLIRAIGPVFTYCGRYKDHRGTYQGKTLDSNMVKKAWKLAVEKVGLNGLQIRDLRHTWKTNAHRSKMDPTTRNAICGHASRRSVEDLYINLSDQDLLNAVDAMTFDNGWTQLDVVEEISAESVDEKSDAKMTPNRQTAKKKVVGQHDLTT